MAKISTKELFDLAYADEKADSANSGRIYIERPEIYEYEEKIGKQLVDMDVDELIDMIKTFKRKYVRSGRITYGTCAMIITGLKKVFNYYINNIELIRNPLDDKRLKTPNLMAEINENAEGYSRFNNDTFNEIVEKINANFTEPMSSYYECVIQLYYNGISNPKEIALIKEEDIDFEKRTITLPGRTVYMSERCAELLQYVHNMESVEQYNNRICPCVTYRGGYFKFIVFKNYTESINDRDLQSISRKLDGVMNRAMKEIGVKFSRQDCFNLGFYNRLVREFGEERTNELLLSVRDKEATSELFRIAQEYGVNMENVTRVKNNLRELIGIE